MDFCTPIQPTELKLLLCYYTEGSPDLTRYRKLREVSNLLSISLFSNGYFNFHKKERREKINIIISKKMFFIYAPEFCKYNFHLDVGNNIHSKTFIARETFTSTFVHKNNQRVTRLI